MIMLLALPVLLLVASAHRYLAIYAPSNVLARRVRASRPTLRTCALLVVLAAVLLVAMKGAASAVEAGAPGWLNLVVLVLAWDAIKTGLLAITVLVGCGMERVRTGSQARSRLDAGLRVDRRSRLSVRQDMPHASR